MHEMENIGNAYEEMAEQNGRLLQQLQQKEDSNLELMAQQIKASQLTVLLRDERDALEAKMAALQVRFCARVCVFACVGLCEGCVSRALARPLACVKFWEEGLDRRFVLRLACGCACSVVGRFGRQVRL